MPFHAPVGGHVKSGRLAQWPDDFKKGAAAARELPNLPLEDALQLVDLYAERGSPKYEKAAMRWLERYLSEGTPRLQHFAEITASLAKRETD